LVKYTYTYIAEQFTLLEITNLSYKFCDKFAKFQNDEMPQIANFAFQYRNAGLVKYVNVL